VCADTRYKPGDPRLIGNQYAKGCLTSGRPRTAIPQSDELIELGKDLVEWASEKHKKGEPLRVRFCEWYTDRGFVRKQWESFRDLPEFIWYYEKARTIMASRYVDGTVNHSIAHRYLRIYDPELRDEENDTKRYESELRKAEEKLDQNINLYIDKDGLARGLKARFYSKTLSTQDNRELEQRD